MMITSYGFPALRGGQCRFLYSGRPYTKTEGKCEKYYQRQNITPYGGKN